MRALDAGEDFIITRNGVPVGRLTPIGRNTFATRDAVCAAFQGAPRIDAKAFRESVDALIDEDPTPRG